MHPATRHLLKCAEGHLRRRNTRLAFYYSQAAARVAAQVDTTASAALVFAAADAAAFGPVAHRGAN